VAPAEVPRNRCARDSGRERRRRRHPPRLDFAHELHQISDGLLTGVAAEKEASRPPAEEPSSAAIDPSLFASNERPPAENETGPPFAAVRVTVTVLFGAETVRCGMDRDGG